MFKKFKVDIVISHYKEDLKWIEGLNHESIENIFLYTKSKIETKIKNNKLKNFKLSNLGRESQTYLYHCIENYENINFVDFIFFLQGNPHGLNANKIKNKIETVRKKKLEFTDNYKISCAYDFLKNGRCKYWQGVKLDLCKCDIREWANEFIETDLELNNYPIFWNACFGVSTKKIASVDIKRYKKILNELNRPNPECGHYCERLWYYIFNMDKKN